MHVDNESLCRLAGLLEGEGCFTPATPSNPNRPVVSIGMVDEDIIGKVAKLMDCSINAIDYPKHLHWNTTYRTALLGRRGIYMMRVLYPLMGLRRQQQIDRVIASYAEPPTHRGKFTSRQKITQDDVRAIKRRIAAGC